MQVVKRNRTVPARASLHDTPIESGAMMMTHSRPWLRSMLVAAAALSASFSAAAETSATDIVRAYTDAFNREDADAMAELMDPDIEWMVMGANGLESVSTNKEQLIAQMRGYFAGPQTVTSTLSGIRETDGGVYLTETASWTGDNGRKQSTTSDVFYSINDDGLIRKVQYLDAQSGGQ